MSARGYRSARSRVRMAGGIGGLSSFGSGDARPVSELARISGGGRIVHGGRAIREVPPDERPRERLAMRGAGGLSAAELIGLLWGSGSRGRSAVDLASDALARHEGLTGLARAGELELVGLPGVGAAKAAQPAPPFQLRAR